MKGLFVLLLLVADTLLAYRFVCNGVLASGEERGDECGVCDEKSAARWENPNIPVVVGESPLPKGLKRDDWLAIVDSSFKAWEIEGSSLRFISIDGENMREFGANESLHEIFWITDKNEWRKLVGSGEFGTLGATLPSYICGDDESGRIILDADLVLNGIGYINWKKDCNSEDCMSIQTTLVHELGHFFGLDHEFVFSAKSIMSARAGFDLLYPLYDDMEGIRALYPNGEKGGFGFSCKKDSDCSLGNSCITDGDNQYCSNKCDSDSNCDHGAVCEKNDDKKSCTFINALRAHGKKQGESCTRVPCAESMICAGIADPFYYCFDSCESDADCKDQKCVTLDDGASLCVTIRSLGEPCDHKELCQDDLFCVFDNPLTGICRAPCSLGCKLNESCQMLDEGEAICLPSHNNLKLDDAADNFNKDSSSGNLGRDQPTKKMVKQTGCQASGHETNHLFWWVFVFAMGRFFISLLKRPFAVSVARRQRKKLGYRI